jgi:hypothetical protein
VTFNAAGNYVLRLTVRDSEIEVCDDLPVSVAPNPNVYEDWIALAFPGVTNLATTGIASDPDRDRVANLVEFGLGMTPSVAGASHFGPGSPGLPRGGLVPVDGTNYLALRVQRPEGRLGIEYQAEVSSDFIQWFPGLEIGLPVPNGDGTEVVTYRDFLPVQQSRQRLMRLRLAKLP